LWTYFAEYLEDGTVLFTFPERENTVLVSARHFQPKSILAEKSGKFFAINEFLLFYFL
tara:strand:- start:710 stop:883 length:174 start_codon:yes stop_codon:yes gene_type:complete